MLYHFEIMYAVFHVIDNINFPDFDVYSYMYGVPTKTDISWN